ncbi:hypothetical protein NUU61_004644 [Penicillium alfredii]|uniref:Altered inheritance of mitochondria protein 9, mitochondrial n=1 Tax=Penicillium alfredii TaxID=1506179 RepID=A0A9W9KET9_9EURO|nr:uncharacterized protein NUU61_004644 [Penicillium alfredii]KAJ5102422.1 hypothetical protein NUU61_004644 [Penicillium alfredii]
MRLRKNCWPTPINNIRRLTQRRLTIQAHGAGKEVGPEELFRYSYGRFLVNEEYELAKRYSTFDISALCQMVSSLPAVRSPIVKIDKREGGYNKALLMTAESGHTVITKLPCPNIVPREYGTASEVAVLKFVKSRSRSPVSDVLAWSADPSNPIGSEYIVQEKCAGQQLTGVWDQVNESDRVKLIRDFAQLESSLASIELPGYGALFLRDQLPASLEQHPRPLIEVDDTYCLGPIYHGSWPGGFAADPEEYAQHSGPWKTFPELGRSLAQQGIWQIQHYKTSYAGRGPHHGTPEEHIRMLERAMDVMSILAESHTLQRHSQAVLCHPDFHPGNIFVSNEDPTVIQGVIDWQFTSVMPRFTQVRWPLFLNPPEGYQTGMNNPELRPVYDRKKDQEQAKRQEQAMRTKCYEAALVKSHLESYLTLTETDVSIRQLFIGSPYTYRDGIIPLRESLVRLYQTWDQLDLHQPCPYRFTNEEVAQHDKQLQEYRDWLKLREYTHQLLHSNDGGWVPPNVDFAATKAKHEKLFRHFVESKKVKMSEEDAQKLWFFRERG